MATGKVRREKASRSLNDPPPKVWPFPTWKGQPYKQPKQRKKRIDRSDLPEALF